MIDIIFINADYVEIVFSLGIQVIEGTHLGAIGVHQEEELLRGMFSYCI